MQIDIHQIQRSAKVGDKIIVQFEGASDPKEVIVCRVVERCRGAFPPAVYVNRNGRSVQVAVGVNGQWYEC